MKNITVSVDEETYRRARIVAAERNASVSALVREFLRSLASGRVEEDDGTAALFAAFDKAKGYRASARSSREDAHARGRVS